MMIIDHSSTWFHIKSLKDPLNYRTLDPKKKKSHTLSKVCKFHVRKRKLVSPCPLFLHSTFSLQNRIFPSPPPLKQKSRKKISAKKSPFLPQVFLLSNPMGSMERSYIYHLFIWMIFFMGTLPETNVAPENRPPQ